jgi:hypothetical protein
MKTKLLLPAAAFLFLAASFVSGSAVSQRVTVDTFRHIQVFDSGFARLKHFFASVLYLQLDDYHHIAMFQGVPWTQNTDYLPQMWLIAKLDPHFTDVYTDAAYHLVVNLGMVNEGMSFLDEGVRNNPDSLDIRFEQAYLLWETGEGTYEEITDEIITYRALVRRSMGDIDQPYNEPSSAAVLAELIEAKSDSLNPYRLFYRKRSANVRQAMREGLYYPGYLATPPEFLCIDHQDGVH